MWRKKFIAIFSACLILQVQSKSLTCSYKGINDQALAAKSVLKDLEKIVSAAVEIALTAINGLESSLKVTQKYVMDVAKDLIYEVGDDIFEKLNELKQGAYTLGIDIIDCLEDREDDLKQLPMIFLNKTSECAVERVNEVLDIFSEIALDIQNANEVVKILTDQLDQCGNDIECIELTLGEIEKATSEIPDAIKGDIQKAQQKIEDLTDYLFECYHDNFNQLQITSQEIFNGLVECVENKIVHHTTPIP